MGTEDYLFFLAIYIYTHTCIYIYMSVRPSDEFYSIIKIIYMYLLLHYFIIIISNYIFPPRHASLNGSDEPALPSRLARTSNDSLIQAVW